LLLFGLAIDYYVQHQLIKKKVIYDIENLRYISDVLATDGRYSIINIYDRRYSSDKQQAIDTLSTLIILEQITHFSPTYYVLIQCK